jgi:hypothetical protein
MSKYLELFRNAFDDSIDAKTKLENKPYIGYSIEEGKVVYTKIPNYLCLEPIDSNNQLALAKIGDYSNIQYSFDKSNWNDFTTDPTNPLNLTYISVDKPIYLRGNNPNGILNQTLLVGCKLVSSGKYNISGDVTTLLNEEGNIKDLTPYGEQTFITLFGSIPSSNSGLPIDLPCVDIVDASKLILPSITLSPECYAYMFRDCFSLTTAPELPATTLAERCYESMFEGCTSLTTAPELPAMELADSCYAYMFNRCSSLTTAPKILPATILADYCYNGMFCGCTSLTTAPELPAMTLAENCYQSMFYGCTSLTTAPELPATVLAEHCYELMFDRCSSLNYIKCLATDISAIDCTNGWVDIEARTGTFVKHPNMNNWTTGIRGIPRGWTVEDAEV